MVGLSAAPTLGRVQKLEKLGIISSYHAKVNNGKLGLGFMALVQLSLIRQKSTAVVNFMEGINKIDEVVECLQLTETLTINCASLPKIFLLLTLF